MTEPTREHIVTALQRARDLVQRTDFDVMRALAEATTTAQCEGLQGFKVFRDVRAAVNGDYTLTGKAGVQLLDAAIKAVNQ